MCDSLLEATPYGLMSRTRAAFRIARDIIDPRKSREIAAPKQLKHRFKVDRRNFRRTRHVVVYTGAMCNVRQDTQLI